MLLRRLLFHRVRPVFVFDGATPVLKQRTLVARRRRKEGQAVRVQRQAEQLLMNQLKCGACFRPDARVTQHCSSITRPKALAVAARCCRLEVGKRFVEGFLVDFLMRSENHVPRMQHAAPGCMRCNGRPSSELLRRSPSPCNLPCITVHRWLRLLPQADAGGRLAGRS